MHTTRQKPCLLFRVWIARYEKWQPDSWDQLPPRAVAVEPADASPMSAREAIRFLEGFNRTMLARPLCVWAVAVPVSIRYEGDLSVGALIRRGRTKLLDCNAQDAPTAATVA